MQFSGMSREELRFVRLYVTGLKREYACVKSVCHLMHPAGLGVKNFIDAVNVARGLDAMQQEFDSRLAAVQKKNKMRRANVAPMPTTADIVDLFSLSFFKVATVVKESSQPSKVYSDGWFSGKPDEWKKTLLLAKDAPLSGGPTLPNLLSELFQAALKFFPFNPNKWADHFGTKKIWPENEKNYWDEDDDEPDYFDGPYDDDD